MEFHKVSVEGGKVKHPNRHLASFYLASSELGVNGHPADFGLWSLCLEVL
jgi:hypothetical protein